VKKTDIKNLGKQEKTCLKEYENNNNRIARIFLWWLGIPLLVLSKHFYRQVQRSGDEQTVAVCAAPFKDIGEAT
jgi:hypothetical protein